MLSFLDNWAGLIGAVSTVFSVLAFVQATAAARNSRKVSKEIETVRDQLVKKTLAEELASLRHDVARALAMLTRREWQAAYEVLHPTLSELRLLYARRNAQMDEDQLQPLEAAIEMLQTTTGSLCGQEMEPEDIVTCNRQVNRVLESLDYCQGIALAVVDSL